MPPLVLEDVALARADELPVGVAETGPAIEDKGLCIQQDPNCFAAVGLPPGAAFLLAVAYPRDQQVLKALGLPGLG